MIIDGDNAAKKRVIAYPSPGADPEGGARIADKAVAFLKRGRFSAYRSALRASNRISKYALSGSGQVEKVGVAWSGRKIFTTMPTSSFVLIHFRDI